MSAAGLWKTLLLSTGWMLLPSHPIHAASAPSVTPHRAGMRGETLVRETNRLAGDPGRLFVRDWAFDPLTDPLPALPDYLSSRPTGATRYRIVQFHGPIDGAIHESMERISGRGVTSLSYLPNNAFVIRLDRPEAAGLVASLPRLRWTGPVVPAFRIAGELTRLEIPFDDETSLVVGLFADEELGPVVRRVEAADPQLEVVSVEPGAAGGRIRLVLPTANLPQALSVLAAVDGIESVDRVSPVGLLNNNSIWVTQSYDTVNKTNFALSATIWNHGITGTGQVIGFSDTAIDTNSCFLKYGSGGEAVAQSLPLPQTGTVDPTKKVLAYYLMPGCSANLTSRHGTPVAGSIAGDNFATPSTPTAGGHDYGDGMAPNAQLVAQSISTASGWVLLPSDLAAMFTQARSAGARIYCAAWGGSGPADYDMTASDFDTFLWNNEDFLIASAAGNGGGAPADGTVVSPATAKNSLAVGATTNGAVANANDLADFSSRGPTTDGRRKPDVLAPGAPLVSADEAPGNASSCATAQLNGTSFSTGIVAGTLALARQYYVDGWYPTGTKVAADSRTPSGALMKATIVNGAMPLTGLDGANGLTVTKIPSMDQGWGRVHLERSLGFAGDPSRIRVWDIRNADGLATGQLQEYALDVAADQPLRVTLAWTDPAPATLMSGLPLVNDLDLEVEGPTAGTIYKGNVFADSVSSTGGTADALDSLESVLLASPVAGSYTLRVIGRNVPGTGSAPSRRQGYALVASFSASCTTTATSAPTGLTATNNSATGIDLAWTAASGATGYNVYRTVGSCSDPASGFSLLGATNGTSFTDMKVVDGQSVAYLVRSTDGCSESSASTCAAATFVAPPPRPVPDGRFVPGAPMKARQNGDLVDLIWDATTCAASDYNAYWGAISSSGFSAFLGGACDLGATGSASGLALPIDSWLVVAGTSAGKVSSFGRNSTGAEEAFTGFGSGGVCPTETTRDTTASCP